MEIDRIAPTKQPDEAHIGYQNWRTLLFVHWRVPAVDVAKLLPTELTVDTFDGDAWVGLVPFTMHGIRPRWAPAIPGLSNFHETNVRTYVHCKGTNPGVWFFSLDAMQSLAVRIARWKWHLPYFRSNLRLNRNGDLIEYEGNRLWPEPSDASYALSAKVDTKLASSSGQIEDGLAIPGSLTHFLAERYYLYSQAKNGNIYRGQVAHASYRLQEAKLEEISESLLAAAGIQINNAPANVLYSEGVDTKIYPLKPI